MKSFRTELELVNHSTKEVVEKDIYDLAQKIEAYKNGSIHEDKFKALRLTRGVYGQRQQGVQMVRMKFPFGKVNSRQLLRLADISDAYSNGNLHITTRQDIQIHHVSLDKTPELWAKLEQDEITIREACGNTVRNVTASAEAGIDPNEPFDVSPYADEVFRYFLRKPFGQELGRKVKIAFSNNENDTAYTFMHDFGFIPKINQNNAHGFKVLIGGGLGAQPYLAITAYEFLDANKIIPFIEASIRVFDRYGERVNRHKARLKYLIQKMGLDAFLNLVNEEKKTLSFTKYNIANKERTNQLPPKNFSDLNFPHINKEQFEQWKRTNTFAQKQEGYHGVYVKIALGNFSTSQARSLAFIVDAFAAENEMRFTINQGILLKFISADALPFLYEQLQKINFASPGFDSTTDITACPGTDTCNLAIVNSTQLAKELGKIMELEFPDLIFNRDIKIKISGCMNSCGQHSLAQIGFHGSSFKIGTNVIPAVQVVLGGGTLGNGEGRIAEKIIKVASKRAPEVLRLLLNDINCNASGTETFNVYYEKKGKDYFYNLLKPQASTLNLAESDYFDWGSEEKYKTAIGVGECAGVIIDLVQTLFYEAEDKLNLSAECFEKEMFADSVYYTYSAFINGAKAMLLDAGIHVNTHHVLITDFDKVFSGIFLLPNGRSFEETVLQIKKNVPDTVFAKEYYYQANQFLKIVGTFRNQTKEALNKN